MNNYNKKKKTAQDSLLYLVYIYILKIYLATILQATVPALRINIPLGKSIEYIPA